MTESVDLASGTCLAGGRADQLKQGGAEEVDHDAKLSGGARRGLDGGTLLTRCVTLPGVAAAWILDECGPQRRASGA